MGVPIHGKESWKMYHHLPQKYYFAQKILNIEKHLIDGRKCFITHTQIF